MSTLTGLFPSAGASIVDKQTFTASGTWTKPAGVLATDLVVVDLWGGGGSGGVRAAADNITGNGGAGGGHNRVEFRAGDLNATESVVVGAGGTAVSTSSSSVNGNVGGFSDFKGFRAYGGAGGGDDASSWNKIPSGGGTLSAGTSSGSNGRLGGGPRVLGPRIGNSSGTNFSDTPLMYWFPGEWGGGGAYSSELDTCLRPIHGGAASITWESQFNTSVTDPIWRSSIWGGAAGGGYSQGSGSQTGGTSQYGGNGGSVPIPASNTSNVNGVAGSPRGGGGSGAKWGTAATVTSGAGGRGEVVITIYRGI